MLSPFFACVLSSAKMRSCLRIRLAPSISIVLAMSRSSETCLVLSSERCMAREKCRANTTKGRPKRPMNDAGVLSWELPARRKEGGAAGNHDDQHRLDLKRRLKPSRLIRAGTQSKNSVAGLQVAVKKCCQLRLGERAHLLRVHLSALVQDDGRDAADAVFPRCGGVGVDVELGDGQLALIRFGDFVENRCKHLARTAPLRPE